MEDDYRKTINTKLRAMRDITLMDVEAENVRSISDIAIDESATPESRVMSLIDQTGNPYVYRDGGVLVKLSFADKGRTLQSCMEEYLTGEILLSS